MLIEKSGLRYPFLFANIVTTCVSCPVFDFIFDRDEIETLKTQLKQKDGELELRLRSSADMEQEVK